MYRVSDGISVGMQLLNHFLFQRKLRQNTKWKIKINFQFILILNVLSGIKKNFINQFQSNTHLYRNSDNNGFTSKSASAQHIQQPTKRIRSAYRNEWIRFILWITRQLADGIIIEIVLLNKCYVRSFPLSRYRARCLLSP